MTGQTPDPFGPDRIPADPAPADTPPDDLIGRARHRADTAADLKARDIATTGHSWDGIQEYDNPLPRWWLWTFYACIVYAIGYSIAYPAWPMVTSATRGVLGYSTRAEVAQDIARVDAANAGIKQRLVETDLVRVADDPELLRFATSAGASVYRTWCAQCHGAGAAGAVGYPNHLDDDWLWGGDLDAIYATTAHGIRNTTDPDATIPRCRPLARSWTAIRSTPWCSMCARSRARIMTRGRPRRVPRSMRTIAPPATAMRGPGTATWVRPT